jgi:hypothetical protein
MKTRKSHLIPVLSLAIVCMASGFGLTAGLGTIGNNSQLQPGTSTFSNLDDLSWWGSCDSSHGEHQDNGTWGCCGDTGCSGGKYPANFNMTPNIANPSEDGGSRQFTVSGPAYADDLFWLKFGAQNWANQFQWDFDLYVDQNSTKAQALEFDLFQWFSGEKYMFGSQCKYNAKWQGWNETTHHWVDTNLPCQTFSPDTWHHVSWRLERIEKNDNQGACPADNLHYVSLTIDQTTYPIKNSSGGPMCEPPGSTTWHDNFGVQWQQDIGGSGTGFTEWIDKANLTIWSSTGTTQQNDAQFISQNVPTTMNAGQKYPVSITMKNSGGLDWTGSSKYGLGSQNPQDNQTWGLGRVYVPSSATVQAGDQYTFGFDAVAPSTPGVYNFQWRMLEEHVEWFGDFTNNVSVTVQGNSSNLPTLASISPSSATAGGLAFTLTATGTHFVSNSVVQWNGSDLATTFISKNQLNSTVSASDIQSSGTANITVFNPGVGTSNALIFTINPLSITDLPTPTLSLPAYLPVNAQINASYMGSDQASYFAWTFTPVSQIPQGSLADNLGSIALSQNLGVHFNTSSPQANLSTVQLGLGPYLVSVQVYDNSNHSSPPAQAYVTLVPSDLSTVRVFPNPWRADKHGGLSITFDNLTVNTTINIFTVSGHWIKTLPTSSSSVTWDLTNDSGEKVASGLYVYLIKDDQGQKKTGQLAIIK